MEVLEENTRITEDELEVYCKKYLETFSRTKAYKAVHPNCTHESAISNGLRYFSYPKVQEYLRAMLQDRVMTTDEIFTTLTERARDTSNKQTQLKALELLGRTKALFLDRTDLTTQGKSISWTQFVSENQETNEKE